MDYQNFVGDTIYNDIFFETLDFRKQKIDKPNTLAFNIIYNSSSCEIIVNNEERYAGLDFRDVKNKNNYDENSYFVYATVMHEISHYYFQQVVNEMRIENIEVNQYYRYTLRIYPNPELQYGAKFIEEGICEYLKYKWGLAPLITKDYKPQNKYEIHNQGEKYPILYAWSSEFVREFMDCQIKLYGRPRNALMILLHNEPPSYEEILDPQKFYKRLSIY